MFLNYFLFVSDILLQNLLKKEVTATEKLAKELTHSSNFDFDIISTSNYDSHTTTKDHGSEDEELKVFLQLFVYIS